MGGVLHELWQQFLRIRTNLQNVGLNAGSDGQGFHAVRDECFYATSDREWLPDEEDVDQAMTFWSSRLKHNCRSSAEPPGRSLGLNHLSLLTLIVPATLNGQSTSM